MSFFFEASILNFFCFISVKKAARLYEVLFFSALWMVFPESWKRSCPNFYAHDCTILCILNTYPNYILNIVKCFFFFFYSFRHWSPGVPMNEMIPKLALIIRTWIIVVCLFFHINGHFYDSLSASYISPFVIIFWKVFLKESFCQKSQNRCYKPPYSLFR